MAAKILADEILVISLPERTDRRNRVEALFSEEEISFRFVDGIRVCRSEINETEISELYWAAFKATRGWDSYLKAAVGCKRAHINCLRYGLETGLNSLLIMEDDVAFRDDWYLRFLQACGDLPKGWLQLYLSAGSVTPSTPVTPHLHRLTFACQTTAILYSRNGMEAALNCVLRARAELDWWMGLHLHPYGCSYEVKPQITYQTGGYSDCLGTVRGETA
ncbi:MAG: glycosyltransferase family 25 protein [Verrucomicrobiota bacterium]|nr:glycosyltransferase family 25 protein [Verrucomicrobiota bacterium]